MPATYAQGKVVTGFSYPYVAAYSCTNGEIAYTNAQELARGVKVSLEPESADASNFYANNIVAETEGGGFTGATLTLTVDGLFATAERFILGLQTAGSDGFSDYNANSKAPFVGVGFIVRSMSNHNVIYTPVVLYKAMFKQPTQEAETQGDEISWQTTELSATVMRADTTDLRWKAVGTDYETEADALSALQTKLGYVAPTPPGP